LAFDEGTAATLTIVRGRRARVWRAGAAVLAVAAAVVAGAVLRPWRVAVAPGSSVEQDPAVPRPPAPPSAGVPPVPPFPAPAESDPAAAAPSGTGAAAPEPRAAAAELDAEPPRGATETDVPVASREDGTKRTGVLYVNATPWAQVLVDGRPAGETPLTTSLPPGKHRVRAVHPSYGSSETVIEIRAGRRVSWTPSLRRD
jgi:hypothetical protein